MVVIKVNYTHSQVVLRAGPGTNKPHPLLSNLQGPPLDTNVTRTPLFPHSLTPTSTVWSEPYLSPHSGPHQVMPQERTSLTRLCVPGTTGPRRTHIRCQYSRVKMTLAHENLCDKQSRKRGREICNLRQREKT